MTPVRNGLVLLVYVICGVIGGLAWYSMVKIDRCLDPSSVNTAAALDVVVHPPFFFLLQLCDFDCCDVLLIESRITNRVFWCMCWVVSGEDWTSQTATHHNNHRQRRCQRMFEFVFSRPPNPM